MKQTRIQSVDRAIDLLQAVARQTGAIGVRELARQTGLKPATAQHLLFTLASRGLLAVDERTRGYRPGLGLFQLTQAVDLLDQLTAFSRPYVEALQQELNESVGTFVRQPAGMQVLLWRQPPSPLVVMQSRAILTEYHHLASGRVFLAWQTPEERRVYFQNVPNVDGKALEKALTPELERARELGYAQAIDVNQSGVAAFSAPAFDANGRIVLTLACSGPLSRLDVIRQKQVIARLQATATAMTQALSFQQTQQE